MNSKVLSVDENDEPTGLVEKHDAHRIPGVRHRAFTVVLKRNNKILLARRSSEKLLWPGYWDGTVASHQFGNEPLTEVANNRIESELGLKPEAVTNLRCEQSFEYKNQYEDIGVEWEICHLLVGSVEKDEFDLNASEVESICFMELERLNQPDDRIDMSLCPWFKIALNKLSL